jgi:hypothetical protein
MIEPAHMQHVLHRLRALLGLAVVAWLPALLLVFTIVVLGGGAPALTANVFVTLLVTHAAVVLGHALAVPAMFHVLHHDSDARAALRESRRVLPVNAAIAIVVVPVSLLAVSLWPEIWGTVSEVLAVQMLAVAPIILACQLAWMQQVADGGDAPTVATDTWHLLRACGLQLAAMMVPAYVVLYGIVAANLVPVITAPLALSVVTIPFTVWTWQAWCRVTGARPAWEAPVRKRASSDAAATTDGAVASGATRLVPVLLGGGGPAKLDLTTTPGTAAGAWLQLDRHDTFTASIRVGDGASREWAAYLWRPGGQWRELEQLWNDGHVLIAHGTCWGDRAYVAFARRDGAVGVPFTAWISVATQSAAQDLPDELQAAS